MKCSAVPTTLHSTSVMKMTSIQFIALCALTLFIGDFVKCLAKPPNATPIVLWHGMGDNCCLSWSMTRIKNFLEIEIKGVYVKSVMVGHSTARDFENSYFMMSDEQFEFVCQQLRDDPKLQGGFNAIGFSQGGLLMRGMVQRCGHKTPPIINLISMGGPQQGLYDVYCSGYTMEICNYIKPILKRAPYNEWVQNHFLLASYWHDPLNEDLYRKHSKFLAKINNVNVVNQTYVDNLRKLKKFVMVKFNNDTVVVPMESEWFGYCKPGQDKLIESLQESELYKEDRLGLKKMDQERKLVFLAVDGDHLEYSDEWFFNNILKPYLV